MFIQFIKRCFNMVFNPNIVFDEKKKEKKIIGIFLLISFGQCVLLMSRYDLFEAYAIEKVEEGFEIYNQQDSPYQISDDTKQEVIKKAPKNARNSLVITEIISYFILTLYVYILNKAFKGKGRFAHYLYVVGYSYIPLLFLYVITVLISFFTKSLLFEIPITSVAAFLPKSSNQVLLGAASKIELFSIWRYILIYIGTLKVSNLKKWQEKFIICSLFIFNLFIGLINGLLTSIFY